MPRLPTSNEVSPWLERDILITVKASPVLSKKYLETVCVAGITDPEGWVRLYPINFRELPDDNQFRKYDLIKLNIKKQSADSRPESYTPNLDSIVRVRNIGSDKDWLDRRSWVSPTLKDSMCEIQKLNEKNNLSLGCFILESAQDVVIEKADHAFMEPPSQSSFLKPNKKRLELIPFKFSLRYNCGPICNGHTQQILDWEYSELFRKEALKHGDKEAFQKVKEKILNEQFHPSREVVLFVGNHSKHPHSFMILGLMSYRSAQLPLFK